MANWWAISRKLYKMLQPAGICESHDMELRTRSGVWWVWILPLLAVTQGTNYDVICDERTLDLTCNPEDDQGDLSFRDIVDISGLSFDVAENMETLYYHGVIKIVRDVPPGPIAVQIDVFRWVRSQWLPTPLSQKRNNFCSAITNPWEIWHPVFKHIPRARDLCPPKKGHIYPVANLSNHVIVRNMPFLDIAGDLKAVIHLSAGGHKTCVVVYIKVTAHKQ